MIYLASRYTMWYKKLMSIRMYRRHSATCTAETDTACNCPVWFSGRLNGVTFPRTSCETRNWTEAERFVAAKTEAPQRTTEPDPGDRLEKVALHYIEDREGEIKDATRYSYKLVLGRLIEFADKHGIVYPHQLTPKFLDDFRRSLSDVAPTTRRQYMSKLKPFLKNCDRLELVKSGLPGRIKPSRAQQEEETQPYTPGEIDRLLAAATGLDRLIIELMYETGLRVSDALNFDPANCYADATLGLLTYQFYMIKWQVAKKRKQQEIFVPTELHARIVAARAAGWRSALPFMWPHKSFKQAGLRVYRTMQALGEQCGITDCRPHRLRDTFACRRLEAGMALEDVSKLLCHATVAQTERSYAPWTRGRKNRLCRIAAAYYALAAQGDGATTIDASAVKLLGYGYGDAQRPSA